MLIFPTKSYLTFAHFKKHRKSIRAHIFISIIIHFHKFLPRKIADTTSISCWFLLVLLLYSISECNYDENTFFINRNHFWGRGQQIRIDRWHLIWWIFSDYFFCATSDTEMFALSNTAGLLKTIKAYRISFSCYGVVLRSHKVGIQPRHTNFPKIVYHTSVNTPICTRKKHAILQRNKFTN